MLDMAKNLTFVDHFTNFSINISKISNIYVTFIFNLKYLKRSQIKSAIFLNIYQKLRTIHLIHFQKINFFLCRILVTCKSSIKVVIPKTTIVIFSYFSGEQKHSLIAVLPIPLNFCYQVRLLNYTRNCQNRLLINFG